MGNAFYGVANLLINRETLYQRVNGVISFVAENPVRAVASHTQVWLSRWYKEVCPHTSYLDPGWMYAWQQWEANVSELAGIRLAHTRPMEHRRSPPQAVQALRTANPISADRS